MIKKLTQNQGKWIWKRPGAYRVLSLMKEGKSISEIAKEIGWKEETIWNFVCSPIFLRKLNTHLKCVFFEFQKNRILAMEEVSKLFWNVVMGRKKIEGISLAAASGYLIKLLKIQEDPKVINPKHIIMNIPKNPEPKESKDLAEIFGFKDLQIPEDEGPRTYTELNK